MAEMTQLEQNNLKTQATLMKDIISNYGSITYSIVEKAKEARKLLHTKMIDSSNVPLADAMVTLSYQDYEKLADILIDLSEESKWEKLGILAKTAVPDNELKRKILNQLRENI